MEILSPYLGFLRGLYGIAAAVLTGLHHWYQLAARAGIMPSWWWIVAVALLITAYLGSGFAASTIGEEKNRGVMLHFWLGLIFPWIYPTLLYVLVPSRKQVVVNRVEKEKKQQRRQSVELTTHLMTTAGIEYQPQEENATAEAENAGSDQASSEPVFGKIYFTGIAMRPDGTPAGPLVIQLTDGRSLEADFILEILDEVIIVQISSPDGRQRKVRLTYDLITGCELKSS